ncbi:MAG TPA: sensor histidine kinase, partial [Phenylobacterium sp.]|nr:sensor histidine kinase [Phenylobacterium sp.]
ALDRINAVAAVHRRLEVGEDPAHFEASGLIRDVAEEIAGAAKRPDVRLELALAPVIIPSRQAGPLALIAGELMRNAMKHAFADRPGVVLVSFGSGDGEVELSVCDDGAGLGATGSPHGFGATLCGLLAQQLRGALEFSDAQPGVRAIVRFPETH